MLCWPSEDSDLLPALSLAWMKSKCLLLRWDNPVHRYRLRNCVAVLLESIWRLRGRGGARLNMTHHALSLHKRQTV